MTVPKQRRTREHRRDRRKNQALKAVSSPHRVSRDNPVYKGRDYSDVFGKKAE